MSVHDDIRAEAERRGETMPQAVRHHLLGGVIARVARSPHAEAFVLRGGMLTRAWVERRPTTDLDYVGDLPFSVDDTARRFATALDLELPDDVMIDRAKLVVRGIWLETAFPGVHLELAIGLGRADQRLGVDIGFGDPLVPPATTIELHGVATRAVRPETQLAWKLHCLVEMGTGWRPKDLADLWLVTSKIPLERQALGSAIVAAFESRAFTRAQAATALDAPYLATKTARIRWEPYRARGLGELATILSDLRERLGPVLKELS